jgi:ubiquinone biosynthesis protein COQ4
MKKTYYFLRLLRNLSIISRDPNQTAAALDIGKCLRALGLLDVERRRNMADPVTAEFMRARRFLPKYDLKELQKLPEGTLGRVYADHMIALGLNPDFYEHIPVTDDVAYSMMRMRETHDLWHIITGFDTSVAGELGLQAFMYAQIDTPLGPILIGGRMLVAIFKKPFEVPGIFDQISKGWVLGNQSKPLFGFEWEKYWHLPLEEVRAMNNIVAALPSPYPVTSIYTAPALPAREESPALLQ